ncbi:MAG TPA: hypothetical protein ENI70_00050, partial [Candidatus Peregrinibacteria bacterium]|nr:hypothetical protein [Candidatus Peregrinibacteria bacterium]
MFKSPRKFDINFFLPARMLFQGGEGKGTGAKLEKIGEKIGEGVLIDSTREFFNRLVEAAEKGKIDAEPEKILQEQQEYNKEIRDVTTQFDEMKFGVSGECRAEQEKLSRELLELKGVGRAGKISLDKLKKEKAEVVEAYAQLFTRATLHAAMNKFKYNPPSVKGRVISALEEKLSWLSPDGKENVPLYTQAGRAYAVYLIATAAGIVDEFETSWWENDLPEEGFWAGLGGFFEQAARTVTGTTKEFTGDDVKKIKDDVNDFSTWVHSSGSNYLNSFKAEYGEMKKLKKKIDVQESYMLEFEYFSANASRGDWFTLPSPTGGEKITYGAENKEVQFHLLKEFREKEPFYMQSGNFIFAFLDPREAVKEGYIGKKFYVLEKGQTKWEGEKVKGENVMDLFLNEINKNGYKAGGGLDIKMFFKSRETKEAQEKLLLEDVAFHLKLTRKKDGTLDEKSFEDNARSEVENDVRRTLDTYKIPYKDSYLKFLVERKVELIRKELGGFGIEKMIETIDNNRKAFLELQERKKPEDIKKEWSKLRCNEVTVVLMKGNVVEVKPTKMREGELTNYLFSNEKELKGYKEKLEEELYVKSLQKIPIVGGLLIALRGLKNLPFIGKYVGMLESMLSSSLGLKGGKGKAKKEASKRVARIGELQESIKLAITCPVLSWAKIKSLGEDKDGLSESELVLKGKTNKRCLLEKEEVIEKGKEIKVTFLKKSAIRFSRPTKITRKDGKTKTVTYARGDAGDTISIGSKTKKVTIPKYTIFYENC